MTLEPINQTHIRARLSADELSSYHITPDAMSVSDRATRTLLDDMLLLIRHMGLRRFGDRVTIECQQQPDGGCDLLFTVTAPTHWLFESSDDLLSALRCGAMPQQQYILSSKNGRWQLTAKCRLSELEGAVLSEFSTPLNEEQDTQ